MFLIWLLHRWATAELRDVLRLLLYRVHNVLRMSHRTRVPTRWWPREHLRLTSSIELDESVQDTPSVFSLINYRAPRFLFSNSKDPIMCLMKWYSIIFVICKLYLSWNRLLTLLPFWNQSETWLTWCKCCTQFQHSATQALTLVLKWSRRDYNLSYELYNLYLLMMSSFFTKLMFFLFFHSAAVCTYMGSRCLMTQTRQESCHIIKPVSAEITAI